MAKLAYAADLKSAVRKDLGVRAPLPAPSFSSDTSTALALRAIATAGVFPVRNSFIWKPRAGQRAHQHPWSVRSTTDHFQKLRSHLVHLRGLPVDKDSDLIKLLYLGE